MFLRRTAFVHHITMAAACAAAIFLAHGARASYVIDSFSGIATTSPWPMNVTASQPIAYGWESAVEGVLGGARNSYLNINNPGQSPQNSALANVDPSRGAYSLTSVGNPSTFAQLIYGGENGLNLDLSTETGFEFDLTSAIYAGSCNLTVWVWDGSPDETGTASLAKSLAAFGPQQIRFDRSRFQGDPLNWSTIQLIVISIAASDGCELGIDEIRTYIPAPGAMLLVPIGIFARPRRR